MHDDNFHGSGWVWRIERQTSATVTCRPCEGIFEEDRPGGRIAIKNLNDRGFAGRQGISRSSVLRRAAGILWLVCGTARH